MDDQLKKLYKLIIDIIFQTNFGMLCRL